MPVLKLDGRRCRTYTVWLENNEGYIRVHDTPTAEPWRLRQGEIDDALFQRIRNFFAEEQELQDILTLLFADLEYQTRR